MVLGHSRKFMEEHFDEIVEFANLKRFLDSPIKNFSSGMKARLGFSVATMVDPDILIVDEVLEVGDYQFRRKCNERMRQMLSGGTTLLFVSHNTETVKRLCDHALWLDNGVVRMAGAAEEVCDAYKEEQEAAIREKKERKRAKLREEGKKYDYLVVGGRPLRIRICQRAYQIRKALPCHRQERSYRRQYLYRGCGRDPGSQVRGAYFPYQQP